MGWQPAFRAEGRIYANYIQAFYPERKIAVLWQNDQFGRDLFRGLQEGLGDLARMIVSDITFDISDKSIDTQIDVLQARARKSWCSTSRRPSRRWRCGKMAENRLASGLPLDNASASIANALRPAGWRIRSG